MPTRIRLQRKGKKGQPFYHLVVADGRAPRDGKFIERLGTYNPMTHPATIDINFDRALYWVQVGAQPTDTVRSILSHKGVFLKYHLLKGVEKGAHTEEQVEEKFQAWLKEKEEKLVKVSKDKELSDKEQAKQQLEYEKKIDEARVSELAKKRNEIIMKEADAKAEKKKASEEAAAIADKPTVTPEPVIEAETDTTKDAEAVTPEKDAEAVASEKEAEAAAPEKEADAVAPEKDAEAKASGKDAEDKAPEEKKSE